MRCCYLRPSQLPLAPVEVTIDDLSLGENLLGEEGVKCRYPYYFGIPLALVEPAIVLFYLGEKPLGLRGVKLHSIYREWSPLVSDGMTLRYLSPKGILLVMAEPAIYHLALFPLETNGIKLRDLHPREILPKEGAMPQKVLGNLNSLRVPLFRGDIFHKDLYSPDLLKN